MMFLAAMFILSVMYIVNKYHDWKNPKAWLKVALWLPCCAVLLAIYFVFMIPFTLKGWKWAEKATLWAERKLNKLERKVKSDD